MNKIKDYRNVCGEYEGEVELFAKTMQPTNYIAALSKAEVAITFDHDDPVINITISSAGGSVNYKDKLQNMPIAEESGGLMTKLLYGLPMVYSIRITMYTKIW